MTTVHRIRLRGGWTVTALPDHGVKRYGRRFGSPREVDPAETVWLTVADLPDPATVTVNGTAFGPATGRLEADITTLLRPRNDVWIDTEGGGEIGEVAVEFRTA